MMASRKACSALVDVEVEDVDTLVLALSFVTEVDFELLFFN